MGRASTGCRPQAVGWRSPTLPRSSASAKHAERCGCRDFGKAVRGSRFQAFRRRIRSFVRFFVFFVSLFVSLFLCLFACLLVPWLVPWFFVCLAVYLVVYLVGWLVGWLVLCLVLCFWFFIFVSWLTRYNGIGFPALSRETVQSLSRGMRSSRHEIYHAS